MTGLSLGLVLLSALAHASWNLLLKRSDDKEVFAWLFLVAATVTFFPLAVWLARSFPVQEPGWFFVGPSIGLQVLYFILLSRGYAQGDLSLVYPVARGTGPMLAVLLLGESIAVLAVAGIVAVIAGIYAVSWWGTFGRIFRQSVMLLRYGGVGYALLTGVAIASYTLVDKRGVDYIQPFLYMYFTVLGAALGIAPYILARRSWHDIREEWKRHAVSIWTAGILTFVAYGLALTAFSFSRVSYVAPVREAGIVFGVVLGAVFLKESFGRGRLVGCGLIAVGIALIALSA